MSIPASPARSFGGIHPTAELNHLSPPPPLPPRPPRPPSSLPPLLVPLPSHLSVARDVDGDAAARAEARAAGAGTTKAEVAARRHMVTKHTIWAKLDIVMTAVGVAVAISLVLPWQDALLRGGGGGGEGGSAWCR